MSVFSTSQQVRTAGGSPAASSGAGSSPSSPACCSGGRQVLADPVSGHTVCSCQLPESGAVPVAARLQLPAYSPRLPSLAGYQLSPVETAAAAALSAGYIGAPDPAAAAAAAAALYANLGCSYDMKDAPGALTALTVPPPYYNPYDPTSTAMYPYTNGYCGFDFNSAAHRKNATREATNTLKAWLNEHKKNPYPTKGEKIMLAIITKMTLTQVSTWFANARRRLKKENKMTWEPRNRTDDDEGDDDDVTCNEPTDFQNDSKDEDVEISARVSDRDSSTGSISPGVSEIDLETRHRHRHHGDIHRPSTALSPLAAGSSPPPPSSDPSTVKSSAESSKPRIWSLADTAMSRPALSSPSICLPAAHFHMAGHTGLPPLPHPAQPPIYPYTSAFAPLKPWLSVPYSMTAALPAPLRLAAAAAVTSHAHTSHVINPGVMLSSRLAAAAVVAASCGSIAPVVSAPHSTTPAAQNASCRSPPQASDATLASCVSADPSSTEAENLSTTARSPARSFSVSELCRKDSDDEPRSHCSR